ncbi:10 kDa chaperonin [Companilactobacillus sp. RD055328]|uniref:co-chaperone GroES n=1 Tax=Companilactobacillus sp. RD055328 TaxID=2916634 RepID=UPI001FC86D74|nr:co-chaperone GroES [Companilactobacillus sp. RD055328]GKQ42126.1 10 kDa chaperonin [Companilactobacillus sp. RD055328]
MLKPLGDRVILTVDSDEEETVGGIVLASNAKEKPQTGTVVAVGDGQVSQDGNKLPMTVSEGDVVMFDKYAGTEVKDGDNKYLVMHEKDIIAIVK